MYTLTVGIEVHAELSTLTKMFCDCRNDSDEQKPNTNICPICLAHPGTLPTINKEAVRQLLTVGAAVEGTLADYSEFDRKNYFYPDLPKAYQLSQYEFPFVTGGSLNDVALTRIHLEEDTARSVHVEGEDASMVDFNRAGVPLLELVTEPVVHSATQAANFGRELQLLLRTLGVSKANMEKGEMRVEANISVSKKEGVLGTKVEVKNLNSFKVVEKAIQHEEKRQIELLEQGGKIVQETRGWDESRQRTFSQRVKEEAADYRYFPDPDLPKLKLSEISEFDQELLNESLPELPEETRVRLSTQYALPVDSVEMYLHESELLMLLDTTAEELREEEDHKKLVSLASNYILNDLKGLQVQIQSSESSVSPSVLAQIVMMAHAREISSNSVTSILESILKGESVTETSLRTFVQEKGLLQENDAESLVLLVKDLVSGNVEVVESIKSGKTEALQYLVGQGMKESKGTANPAELKRLLEAEIGLSS